MSLEDMRIGKMTDFEIAPHNISITRTDTQASMCTHLPSLSTDMWFHRSFPFCPFGNIKTSAGTMNTDVLKKQEWSWSKLQPQGTFQHNVGEQGDQSVTWSCYATHIQTCLDQRIQKIEQRGKKEELFFSKHRQTAKGREKVDNHQMERRKHHNKHLHF